MHIVHYIQHLREIDGAGVVRAVLDLTSALATRGHKVTIATQDPGALAATTHDGLLRCEVFSTRGPGGLGIDAGAQQRLDRLVAAADVVHLHTIWDPCNWRFARAARRHHKPYVFSTHGMLNRPAMRHRPLKKRVFWQLGWRRLLSGAARIHTTASGERRQVSRYLPGSTIDTVSLVFDAGVYSNLPGPELARQRFDCLSHAGPKVLFLSRLNPIKAPELAIAATAKLMRTHDLHLVLAGPGDANYIAQLRQLASEQGCANRLTFVGEVSGAEKLSLYQACDLFMLPTRQENFGMVYPEAIACGLPVVTSDTIDLANELAALGVRVVPRTVSAFAEAADELLGDLAASHLQADETRRQMFEWLDTDRVVAEYVAMYERATANPPHSDATANKL